MSFYEKIRFPCGYESEIRVYSGLFEITKIDIDITKLRTCPLHGSKCVRNIGDKK